MEPSKKPGHWHAPGWSGERAGSALRAGSGFLVGVAVLCGISPAGRRWPPRPPHPEPGTAGLFCTGSALPSRGM